MHATYTHNEGWFPVVGVRFERLSDLLMAFCILALALTTLAYALTSGRRAIAALLMPVGGLLISLLVHAGITAAEMASLAYTTVTQIPLSWYPLAALTVVPIAIDLPRQWAVWFLLAHCAANAWIVLYRLEPPDQADGKDRQANKTERQPHPNTDPSKMGPKLFAGLRISIGQ